MCRFFLRIGGGFCRGPFQPCGTGFFSLVALGGCQTIPEGYRRDFLPAPNAGYRITDESASGFDLEVYYFERGVFLKRDKLVADAKSTYVQIAAWLSSRIGRTPRNISRQDLNVRFSRGLMDGL